MKTVIDLPRPPTDRRTDARSTTLRLGVVVSSVAALSAVLARTLADVSTLVIVAVVMISGFALSWRAAGRPLEDTHP